MQFIDGGTMISPTVFARRCLCYLMNNMPQEALGDAMQAQVISPDWPAAFYLQAAALFKLGMDNDARETLKDGSLLDAKRKTNWKCIGFSFSFLFNQGTLLVSIHCVFSLPLEFLQSLQHEFVGLSGFSSLQNWSFDVIQEQKPIFRYRVSPSS